jgi:FlaG/FlaF family flagellin (archaellin)
MLVSMRQGIKIYTGESAIIATILMKAVTLILMPAVKSKGRMNK